MLYPLSDFEYQSLDPEGHAPVLTCGEIHLGEAVGRIQFVRVPFPIAGGGTEYITIGLVHEPNAQIAFDQLGMVSTYAE